MQCQLTNHACNQNQNVNVKRAIKNQLEVSLVYCTNQTKRLMEKLKRKPLSSPVSVKACSPMEGVGSMAGRKDLRKRYLLSLEWKRVGVMDNDSGDDETDELRELG